MLATQKALKGDNGHQTPSEEIETLERDDNRYLTSYVGSLERLKRDNVTDTNPERGNSIKVPHGEDDKGLYGDDHIAPDIERRKHSTPIGDKLSIHGPVTKGSCL